MSTENPLSPDTLTLDQMNQRLAPHPDLIAAAPQMLNLADFNKRLALAPAPTPVQAPAAAPEAQGGGFMAGVVGLPGHGFMHGAGAAVLPTAGAIAAGPAGAAAGEATKEAIGAGIEAYQGKPQSVSDMGKILGPAEAAAGQALGEKYVAPVIGAASRAVIGTVGVLSGIGGKIAGLWGDTSGAGRSAVTTLLKFPDEVAAASKTVSEYSLNKAKAAVQNISIVQEALKHSDPVAYFMDAYKADPKAFERSMASMGTPFAKVDADLQNYMILNAAAAFKPWINPALKSTLGLEVGAGALAAHAFAGVPAILAGPAAMAASPQLAGAVIPLIGKVANSALDAMEAALNLSLNKPLIAGVQQALVQSGIQNIPDSQIRAGLMQEAHDHPHLDPSAYPQIVHDELVQNPNEYKDPVPQEP